VTFSVQTRSLPQDLRMRISGEVKTNSLASYPPKVGTSVDDRPRVTPLTSSRTAKYIQAMVHEDFDYHAWLKKVREEDAEAKQAEATGTSGELGPAKIGKPIGTAADAYSRSNPTLRLLPRRPARQAKSQTRKARLGQWLEKVHLASGEFQRSRKRDAVYGYLDAVFTIVMHYKVRRRTTRLLRHAFEFANLPFDKNTEPFTAVIRCTCGNAVDTKMVSKWARALRYASRHKEPDMRLKTFMKKAGGVNACAGLYAKQLGRNNRVALSNGSTC
jgi:hypothetical protein